ncbi:PD-(D/E)XK nuclease family protein [Crocosphaera sp. UHCC 0190]|uniref:PD-(D/E)XK nuclease family protein n=1 Tax=Crocosphaera sp. UHCC 0190 TaxID=3110246 RepID=UPI002B213D1F|nr:PD-(D/E)XK nuclease family protein [Crocosphaera sp. UHCC 0190]MEA5509057.1 PD-(D/E)XK nuclease family protein [Crocosphaera sp. UHCC 0190]
MSIVTQKPYQPWLRFASYALWSDYYPQVGMEHFHCEMQRGYKRFRKQEEPEVKFLCEQDTIPQKVGHLAQRVVWEFHQQPELLTKENGVFEVADAIGLHQEPDEVKERVFPIIQNYQTNPILQGKEVLQLKRGDEDVKDTPSEIIGQKNNPLKLYYVFDCVVQEPDGSLHIVDFKTGKTSPDQRQAYVYLLVAKSLYPNHSCFVSFYNLETQKWHQRITLSSQGLESIFMDLDKISKYWQEERNKYRKNPQNFSQLFPPNPGIACRNCIFNTICHYTSQETK